MEKTVTMPKLGMTMEEGEMLTWRYKEGDWVEKGEPLVEIMTDKVNIEFEAPFDGQLVRILAQAGEVLPVGSPIATMNDGKAEVASTPVQLSIPAPQLPETEGSVILADAHGGYTHAALAQQSVPGTPAAKREAARFGIDLHAVEQSGAKLPLQLADITAFVQRKHDASILPVVSDEELSTNGTTAKSPAVAVRVTPVAQKMAREHQIDLVTLAENKAGGKVTRADVEAHLAERTQETKPPQASTVSAPLAVYDEAESEVIPLSSTRRIIGQRMVQSITTAPHIYLDVEIDMTEAERCRERIGRSLRDSGTAAPSITALLVQAAARSLVLHPEVNSALEPGGPQGKDAIRRWRNVHIGIAVDTERTLLTPVIRHAQQQTLQELSQALRRITQAARDGSIKPDELAGATFTISNLGMYGIDTFHAIIAPGQSAILAVGKVKRQPVVIEEEGTERNERTERIEIRPMMKVSLSADHRVLDGASGTRFLRQFKTFLEDPYLML